MKENLKKLKNNLKNDYDTLKKFLIHDEERHNQKTII